MTAADPGSQSLDETRDGSRFSEPQGDTGAAAVLGVLARGAEVAADPTRAAQAARAAAREIPPTQPRAARLRLSHAAAALRMEVHSRQLSVREALEFVAEGGPLVLFTVTPSGHVRWFALAEARGAKGRLKPLESGDADDWLSSSNLSALFGTADADAVID